MEWIWGSNPLQSSPIRSLLTYNSLTYSILYTKALAGKLIMSVRTVRAQRVVLDKAKAELSADEAAYSQLVDRVDLALLACLAKTLVWPKELPFYEVLVFDAKIAACREALDGSPRAAIKRALSRLHDYLACECCDQVEGQDDGAGIPAISGERRGDQCTGHVDAF